MTLKQEKEVGDQSFLSFFSKMPNILSLEGPEYEDLMLFPVVCDPELNILCFRRWLGLNKHYEKGNLGHL